MDGLDSTWHDDQSPRLLPDSHPIELTAQVTVGRDLSTCIDFGGRILLTIGLVGVAMSFFLGILFGGLSGYLGGTVYMLIQRIIETLRPLPTLLLWMGLSIALPAGWPMVRNSFSRVFSVHGRLDEHRARSPGRFIALREEDSVGAAVLNGASYLRVSFRYLLPSSIIYIIARQTPAIPQMKLGETAPTFVGLGL